MTQAATGGLGERSGLDSDDLLEQRHGLLDLPVGFVEAVGTLQC